MSSTSSDSKTTSKSKHIEVDLTGKSTDLGLDLLADNSKLKINYGKKNNSSTSDDSSTSHRRRKSSKKSSTSEDSSSDKKTYGQTDILRSLNNMREDTEVKNEKKPNIVHNVNVDTHVDNIKYTEPEPINPYYLLDEKQKRLKRLEVYSQLMELKTKHGIKLSKDYSINSDYEEMEFERDFHYNAKNKKNGVNLAKSFLLNGIQAVEFLNDKFNPFKFRLNGWHDHMATNIDDFDEVMAELYEKYKGSSGKMAPELRIILMILFSGFTFHASQILSKNIPGLDEAIKNNPSLLGKLQTTVYASMAKDPVKEKEAEINAQQQDMYRKMTEFKQARENNISIREPIQNNMPPRPPQDTNIEDELAKRQQLYEQIPNKQTQIPLKRPAGLNNRDILNKIKQQYSPQINRSTQQTINEETFTSSLKQSNQNMVLPTQNNIIPVSAIPVKSTIFSKQNNSRTTSPITSLSRNRLLETSSIDTSSDEVNMSSAISESSSRVGSSVGSKVGSRRKPKGMVISIDTK
jgi:hypothetical protein